MFTDAPALSRLSRTSAASSASRTWCGSPQWSNQPCQYSEQNSGPFGWWRRSVASEASGREPKVAVESTPGSLPPSWKPSPAPSAVNSRQSVAPRRSSPWRRYSRWAVSLA
ncbi:hypothetical protein ABH941_000277 [Streptacidiphilus sp. EB103A]